MENQSKKYVRRNNFNRKVNIKQNQIPIQTELFKTSQNQLPENQSSNSIIKVIVIIFIFLVLFYIIYTYSEKIYKYFNESINNTYYLLNSENKDVEKIKCKSGCEKGKCVNKSENCKSDADCTLCVDDEDVFYSKVPSKDDENEIKIKKIEEEDILQNKRIKELEDKINERNKEIEDLNKYIEYLNRNKERINKEKVNIIHEESNIHFS